MRGCGRLAASYLWKATKRPTILTRVEPTAAPRTRDARRVAACGWVPEALPTVTREWTAARACLRGELMTS